VKFDGGEIFNYDFILMWFSVNTPLLYIFDRRKHVVIFRKLNC